jgi:hypothetical protein
MTRVVAIDHLSVRVIGSERPKAFYGKLLGSHGFRVPGNGLRLEGIKCEEKTEGNERTPGLL